MYTIAAKIGNDKYELLTVYAIPSLREALKQLDSLRKFFPGISYKLYRLEEIDDLDT